MNKSLTSLTVVALAVAFAPMALADVSFTAIERPGIDQGAWDFGVFDGAADTTPVASGNASVTSGTAMFWQLAYNGSGLMTYSWGSAANALTNSIQYNVGPDSLDYVTVATQTKPNSKPTATVSNLVFQTDRGILNGTNLQSGDGNTNQFTFAYNGPQTFNAFTLTGSTTFTWNGNGSNPDYLAVVITGGAASPVVAEPASYAIMLIGLATLAMRARRRVRPLAAPQPAAA